MNNVMKKAILVDVRETWEYKEQHITNSILIPFSRLPDELERKLPNKLAEVYVFCSSGERSKVAKDFLDEHGYKKVASLGTIENAREFLDER